MAKRLVSSVLECPHFSREIPSPNPGRDAFSRVGVKLCFVVLRTPVRLIVDFPARYTIPTTAVYTYHHFFRMV